MEQAAVKWHLREAYGVDFQVVTVHQNRAKWVRAVDDLVHCFPRFRSWNFTRGVNDWPEYKQRMRQQETWLSSKDAIHDKLSRHEESLKHFNQTLQLFLEKYHDPNKPFHPMSPKDEISLPFLISSRLPSWALQNDTLLKELFEFDMSGDCCGVLPEEDETVYHFRNFGTELGSRIANLKLKDFGPNQTAHVLMGHLKEGDKVALISRFNDHNTKRQVASLRSRGLQVRVIEGQSGVQDFCFMLQVKKELIGNVFSTFSLWGGVLGDAQTVRQYEPVPRPVDGVEYLILDNIVPPHVLFDGSKTLQTLKVVVGD